MIADGPVSIAVFARLGFRLALLSILIEVECHQSEDELVGHLTNTVPSDSNTRRRNAIISLVARPCGRSSRVDLYSHIVRMTQVSGRFLRRCTKRRYRMHTRRLICRNVLRITREPCESVYRRSNLISWHRVCRSRDRLVYHGSCCRVERSSTLYHDGQALGCVDILILR